MGLILLQKLQWKQNNWKLRVHQENNRDLINAALLFDFDSDDEFDILAGRVHPSLLSLLFSSAQILIQDWHVK